MFLSGQASQAAVSVHYRLVYVPIDDSTFKARARFFETSWILAAWTGIYLPYIRIRYPEKSGRAWCPQNGIRNRKGDQVKKLSTKKWRRRASVKLSISYAQRGWLQKEDKQATPTIVDIKPGHFVSNLFDPKDTQILIYYRRWPGSEQVFTFWQQPWHKWVVEFFRSK